MIVLSGNPISTNNAYRSHGKIRYMTNEAKALKEQYWLEAKSQWKRKPLTDDLEAKIRIFFSDKRKRDWDNYHKMTMDALTGIVYVDDHQIRRARVELYYDKENPRIEINLKLL